MQILLLTQHVSDTTMPIISSSRVLYSGCCLWYFVLWFSSSWSGVELRVMCPVCRILQHPANRTRKICNKKPLLHLVGILFPHINDDARSKSHQNHYPRTVPDSLRKIHDNLSKVSSVSAKFRSCYLTNKNPIADLFRPPSRKFFKEIEESWTF